MNPFDKKAITIIINHRSNGLTNCYLSNHSYYSNSLQYNWLILKSDIKIND